MTTKDSELLTMREACEMIKCHPNTLRSWDKKGLINAVRVGPRKDRRFRRGDLENLIK